MCERERVCVCEREREVGRPECGEAVLELLSFGAHSICLGLRLRTRQ